ncbi:MAG: serine hydrolase [Bacteroidota bacterium]
MTKEHIWYSLFVLLLCFSNCNKNPSTEFLEPVSELEPLKEIIDAYEELYEFSGTVLVGYKDSILFQGAYGFSDYENRRPNNLDIKFRLASLSKQFTAAALLVLEQNGEVDFDQVISTYVPELKPEIGSQITIHQILSHSSGLARDIESLSEEELGKSYISIDSIIQLINTSDLLFEPGSKWAYSNLGYNIAAKIIEVVTGLSYGEALDQLLFQPLGLLNTGHEISPDKLIHFAKGYVGLPEKVVPAIFEEKSYVVGAGSIYSTVNDLFIWSQEITNGDLLNEINKEKFFSKQKGRYSYGWFINSYVWPPLGEKDQAKNPHHEGGSPGFESKISFLTRHDIVVIILSNKLPANVNNLSNQIINYLVGFEEEPPLPRATKAFFDTLFQGGVNAAIELTKEWEAYESTHLIPNSNNVFLIGRGYMDLEEYEKGILIMDYLIAVRPKWDFPYLFKAFMLEEQEKNDQAIAYYSKVLEINPDQSNAKIRLKRLSTN